MGGRLRVVAFLPVKGTSERIKSKNTMLLDGTPLFIYTLEKLMKCEFIDEVYLDTESDEIFEMARHIGCTYLKREAEFATNKTDGHQLFYNEARKVDADIYIQVLGTSPFILPETIRKGVEILTTKEQFDSVILINREKQYTWNEEAPNYDRENIPNSKDLPDTIIETMGLYITNKEVALNLRKRYGKQPYLLNASPIEAIDINYPDDFELANMVAKGIRQRENNQLEFLCKLINSSMLSDILDDMGICGVIQGLRCNIKGKKVFGRAKTLKIRKMQEGEDFKGIYNALKSYEQVTTNDIIIVENECSELAYFGELNTLLSVRAGALATIINGATRDFDNVTNLGYPVFCKGYNCKDVRMRAVLESINRQIQIDGIRIVPNDLIFADNDGVVVIPFKYIDIVLQKLLEKISSERSVVQEIAQYSDPLDIVRKVGEF